MFTCANMCDVAVCSNAVRNVALWLVGHPRTRP